MKTIRTTVLFGAIAVSRILLVPAFLSFIISLGVLVVLPESSIEQLSGLAALILSWLPASIEEVNSLAKYLEIFVFVSVPATLAIAVLPLLLSENRARLLRLHQFGVAKNKLLFTHLATLDLFNRAHKRGYFKKPGKSGIKRADILFTLLWSGVSAVMLIWLLTLALGAESFGNYLLLIVFVAVLMFVLLEQYRPREAREHDEALVEGDEIAKS